MDIQLKISELENLISQKETEAHLAPEVLFSIVQLKAAQRDSFNNERTIYQDSKRFISAYIISLGERDKGYDIVNTDKIIKCISYNNKLDDKYHLMLFASRILKYHNYEDESDAINLKINKVKSQILLSRKYRIGKYWNYLLHLSTYNIFALLTSIFILFAITTIVLLPAPHENWRVFSVSYQNYSDVFLFNHILNLFAYLFGVNKGCLIETNFPIGIVLMVITKLLYIVFIGNYFYRKAVEYLNHR